MKQCCGCGDTKPLEEFHRDKRSADGYKARCKTCRCLATRDWSSRNPAKARAATARWMAANQELMRIYRRRWAETNPDKQRIAQRRWGKANREHLRQQQREWLAANPGRALERRHRRRAREGETSAETAAAMALLKTLPCAYCGATENITIDHIVPLSRGGKHEVQNLAAACFSCNSSKCDRLLSEWVGRVAT